MKNLILLVIITGSFLAYSCKKESQSEQFRLLTAPIWVSDSLLANDLDASGPGGLLEDFKGEAKFNEDFSGSFGTYTGTWRFTADETQLVIESDDLPLPLTTKIVELTGNSLKITTSFPNIADPFNPINLRMTFKPK